MYPLCETDYFARLDLICAQCKQALRSSYITACGESSAVYFSVQKLISRREIPRRALYLLGM